jgi:hypothetical protein
MKKLMMCLVFLSTVAMAGPEERALKKEIEGSIGEASAAFKKACGCDLKIDVKWDVYSDKNALGQIKHLATSIKDDSAKRCAEKEAKVAICKMKTLEVKFGPGSEFTFAGSKGTAQTSADSYVTMEMMTEKLDK